MQSDDRVEVDQEPEKLRRDFPVGIAATAVIIIVGLFFIQPADEIRSADEQTTAATLLPDPGIFSDVDVATGFVEAYGRFDVDRAASYLAAEADLSGLEPGDAEGMPLGNRWLQAQGFKLLLDSCEELNRSTSGTAVRCRFDFHRIRSDEIGLGPFSGSWFDITVLEGEIISVSMNTEWEEFLPQVWAPFHDWVAEAYPTNAAVMWSGGGNPQFTEESIALWEQRTREYVEEFGDDPEVKATAMAFVEAYGSFDVEQAASLLAADADLSRLEGGQEGWRLANRWLEAQGFKLLLDSCEDSPGYGPFGTFVRCIFDFHSLRSDEIGLGPFTGSWFDFWVLDREIVYVSLHWDLDNYSPQMWEPFAAWVAETYPEDVEIMYTDSSQTLERLTEESIQLWEQHSLEYPEFVTASEDGYIARTTAICMAAHARLNEELQAAGIEMVAPGSTDDPLNLITTTDEDFAVYDAAARRIMGETLPELRAVLAPVTVQKDFDHLYGLMDQFAEGEEAPFTPTPGYWVHAVDMEPSLVHCRFSLPG